MSDTNKAKQVVNIIQDYLLKSGDIDELRAVVDEFDQLLEQEERLNTAVITTAFGIDDQLKLRCEEMLKNLFGDDLEFEYLVNPQMLGGIKVQIYDQVIDLSLDTTLTNICHTLKQ